MAVGDAGGMGLVVLGVDVCRPRGLAVGTDRRGSEIAAGLRHGVVVAVLDYVAEEAESFAAPVRA